LMEGAGDSPYDGNSITPLDVEDITRGVTAFESVATYMRASANIVGTGNEPERVFRTLVSANFFDVLQSPPALGRGFEPGEDQPGREREAVLSNRLWRRRFGADPSIVGKTIRVDDQNYLVTGVMPDSFQFPLAQEMWTPMALTPDQRGSRRAQLLDVVARLRS